MTERAGCGSLLGAVVGQINVTFTRPDQSEERGGDRQTRDPFIGLRVKQQDFHVCVFVLVGSWLTGGNEKYVCLDSVGPYISVTQIRLAVGLRNSK